MENKGKIFKNKENEKKYLILDVVKQRKVKSKKLVDAYLYVEVKKENIEIDENGRLIINTNLKFVTEKEDFLEKFERVEK